jgi:peptidoglycan-associated lipoprotein
MQLNKFMRTLVLALPVVTLMACSSGPSEEELAAERNRVAQQQADADKAAREAEQARVKAEAAERMEIESREKAERELAALQNEQTVYFDFDRATVKAEFYPVLDKHATYLVANASQNVVIEGHTDSRGTPEYNIALGERRAKSVETYLLNAGVSASQITVVSYGEEKPAQMAASEYSFAQNRRAVVVYQ